MIKIVYACNDKMFDNLCLSVLSVVRRTKETIKFYLLTADYTELNPSFTSLSEDHLAIIQDIVKKANPKSEFNVIDCKQISEKMFVGNKNLNTYFSVYTLFRLLFDKIPELNDKVIYLDTDTMASGDVKEFYKNDLTNLEFLVSHNYTMSIFRKKDYFNAGVIFFNVPYAKKTGLFEKARRFLTIKKDKYPDQTALYVSAKQIAFFPGDDFRFNRQECKIYPNDVIKHFCANCGKWIPYNNVKQCEIKNVQKHLHIHHFDEDYRIFKEIKDKHAASLRNNYYIRVSNLRKNYGDLKAVDNISFKVKKGSLFAFLGVNGAGKSTTINIISSTLYKDSGDITIDGYDLIKDNAKVKERIGIVFQNSALDDLLTVKENLEIRARFYKMKKDDSLRSIDRVTRMLNLKPILNQAVGKLSGGQKRRVDIARALIHEPQLLMLDEPTTGLDPKTRLDVWRLIDEVRRRTKMTVFLTTHYLEEADKASYVVIMNKGKIIAEGTPNELKNKYSTDTLISYQKKNPSFEKSIRNRAFYYDFDAGAYRISIKDSSEAKLLINKYSKYITDFEIQKGNMDSVFLNATKGDKR